MILLIHNMTSKVFVLFVLQSSSWRSIDDTDLERCLRVAKSSSTSTTPDIVRSTIKKAIEVYDETRIYREVRVFDWLIRKLKLITK